MNVLAYIVILTTPLQLSLLMMYIFFLVRCDTFVIVFFIWSFALDDLSGLDLSIVRAADTSEDKIMPDKSSLELFD